MGLLEALPDGPSQKRHRLGKVAKGSKELGAKDLSIGRKWANEEHCDMCWVMSDAPCYCKYLQINGQKTPKEQRNHELVKAHVHMCILDRLGDALAHVSAGWWCQVCTPQPASANETRTTWWLKTQRRCTALIRICCEYLWISFCVRFHGPAATIQLVFLHSQTFCPSVFTLWLKCQAQDVEDWKREPHSLRTLPSLLNYYYCFYFFHYIFDILFTLDLFRFQEPWKKHKQFGARFQVQMRLIGWTPARCCRGAAVG